MDLENMTGGDASPTDDVRSALEAAFEPAPEPDKTETPPTASQDADKSPARDASGRFAPKSNDDAEDKTPETTTAEAERSASDAPTVKPPASWSKDTHEYWHSLPPAIQAEVLKRERDYEKGLREKAEKYKPFDEIEQVLAPRRQMFQSRGITEAQAIQRLLAAQEMLDRDPVNGLAQIARSYGLDLSNLIAQTPDGQPRPAIDPTVLQLQQQLQALQAERESEKQARQREQEQQVSSEIEKFRSNPDHDLYDLVKEDMAALLYTGRAESLEDAYRKAVRANDDAYALWQAKEAAKRTAPDPKAVAKARAAGSSVKGAPNGAFAADAPKASLREELEAHFGNL